MKFEDVEIGQTVRTEGRTITEADIVNFAGVSGDFYYPHTNEERMKQTGFDGRIAHGALVFSVMTGLLWQSSGDRPEVVALYGIDGMRFTNPVYPGDTIHVETEVVEKETRDHPYGNGVVTNEAGVVNQEGETVLSCEMKILVI
ncbi:MAG: MaoC/PaaZ C-terminal domain-containing protein [Halobacteriales archaeon]|nr:MaoC/PaaZ C-terminal domain-containing protein [Halobacteriales archaeon]